MEEYNQPSLITTTTTTTTTTLGFADAVPVSAWYGLHIKRRFFLAININCFGFIMKTGVFSVTYEVINYMLFRQLLVRYKQKGM
jgi:hypothetical protein